MRERPKREFIILEEGEERACGKISSEFVYLGLFSGPNDHVFINFVDHGAPGLVAFPNDELHASELKEVLKQMHVERKFAKVSRSVQNYAAI